MALKIGKSPFSFKDCYLCCTMYLTILIISFILLVIALAGLALNILVRKNGKFPAYRVGHNRDMHKRGISCVKHEEIRCHEERLKESGCAGCQSG